MTQPVDLSNLRSMIQDDVELERELFATFYESFEGGLNDLQQALQSADQENWRRHAHALKGIAYNLGANRLGDLCKTAQDHPQASEAEKTNLLQSLQIEYASAKQYLVSISGDIG